MKSTLLLLIFSLSAYSQKSIDTLYIKIKIDSLIASKLNGNVIKYFKLENNPSSMRIQDGNKIFPRSFKKGIRENEVFRGGTFYYTFQHPEIPNFSYFFHFKINEKFEFIVPQEFNFIPDFVISGKKSNFISLKKVTEIAKKNISKKGIKMSKPKIEYKEDSKSFNYLVVNTIKEKNDKRGEIIFSEYEYIYRLR
ncbi:hypothetical protein [Flavobacterium sp.]|uniref:hypothetical protein n=1 Tax=Flavobacterium sp. TaxID=239 RepID=UPI003751F08F